MSQNGWNDQAYFCGNSEERFPLYQYNRLRGKMSAYIGSRHSTCSLDQ